VLLVPLLCHAILGIVMYLVTIIVERIISPLCQYLFIGRTVNGVRTGIQIYASSFNEAINLFLAMISYAPNYDRSSSSMAARLQLSSHGRGVLQAG